MGGDIGKGRSIFRNNYKGHMDKTQGWGWKQGREVGKAGVVGERVNADNCN